MRIRRLVPAAAPAAMMGLVVCLGIITPEPAVAQESFPPAFIIEGEALAAGQGLVTRTMIIDGRPAVAVINTNARLEAASAASVPTLVATGTMQVPEGVRISTPMEYRYRANDQPALPAAYRTNQGMVVRWDNPKGFNLWGTKGDNAGRRLAAVGFPTPVYTETCFRVASTFYGYLYGHLVKWTFWNDQCSVPHPALTGGEWVWTFGYDLAGWPGIREAGYPRFTEPRPDPATNRYYTPQGAEPWFGVYSDHTATITPTKEMGRVILSASPVGREPFDLEVKVERYWLSVGRYVAPPTGTPLTLTVSGGTFGQAGKVLTFTTPWDPAYSWVETVEVVPDASQAVVVTATAMLPWPTTAVMPAVPAQPHIFLPLVINGRKF